MIAGWADAPVGGAPLPGPALPVRLGTYQDPVAPSSQLVPAAVVALTIGNASATGTLGRDGDAFAVSVTAVESGVHDFVLIDRVDASIQPLAACSSPAQPSSIIACPAPAPGGIEIG